MFGLYDEGEGLRSLYLTPCSPSIVSAIVQELDIQGRFLDMGTPFTTGAPRMLAKEDLASSATPMEIVHLPGDEPHPEPLSVMADPHAALPKDSDRQFAFLLHDQCHGVLYSRNREVLREALRAFLTTHLDHQAQDTEMPPINNKLVAPLLLPLTEDTWREAQLVQNQRYCHLNLITVSATALGERQIHDRVRWIGGMGRAWRDGWSW